MTHPAGEQHEPATLTHHGLYAVQQLRDIEQAAQAGLPPHTLMQRAGLAAARLALDMLAARTAASPGSLGSPGSSRSAAAILIIAGPGNNGGDAFECGFHLARNRCVVTVLAPLLTTVPPPADSDVAQSLARLCSGPVTFADSADLESIAGQPWALVVDGLFGIGMMRPITGHLQAVVELVNRLDAPCLALDVPSGLDADTGTVPAGPDGMRTCVRATQTLTFIGDKPGLHTCDGRDLAGPVTVAGLDIDAALFVPPLAWLNHPDRFAQAIRPRPQNSHKGSFGDVQVIGGAPGMAGAAILAAHAALKAGAGRVLVGFAGSAQTPSYDPRHPELMCRQADDLDFADAAVVIGPGLGAMPNAIALLERALATAGPLVIDADALNLLAMLPYDAAAWARRAADRLPTLMTPHPLEAARLLSCGAAAVQADRLAAARALAARFSATIILKGSGTVIADGDLLAINPTGNPALASGGTGDVLSGLCGALLAQGLPAREAALAAVWLHGDAADRLVASGIGPIGVTASEVADAIRSGLNQLSVQRPVRRDGRR